MQGNILTIFGGSGFIASEIVYKLSKSFKEIRLLTRNTQACNHLKVIKNKFTLMSLCSDFIVSNDVLFNNNLHIFPLPPNLEENIKTYIREIKCIETQLKDILLALTLDDVLTINGKNVDDDYESGENDWFFLLCYFLKCRLF